MPPNDALEHHPQDVETWGGQRPHHGLGQSAQNCRTGILGDGSNKQHDEGGDTKPETEHDSVLSDGRHGTGAGRNNALRVETYTRDVSGNITGGSEADDGESCGAATIDSGSGSAKASKKGRTRARRTPPNGNQRRRERPHRCGEQNRQVQRGKPHHLQVRSLAAHIGATCGYTETYSVL